MQGRNKNQCLSSYGELKKSGSLPAKEMNLMQQIQNRENYKRNRPFQYMWSRSEENKIYNYDSLLDSNAHSYFISPSLINYCNHLEKQLFKSQNRSSSNLTMGANLLRKKRQVKKDFAAVDKTITVPQNDNYKIIPYAATLKPSSKYKIKQLKKNYVSQLTIKQREHRQLLKKQCYKKDPERHRIRVVSTLQPIQQMEFVKKNLHFQQNGRDFTVLFRPRNCQSLKT